MTRLREEKIEDLQRSRAQRRQEWKEVTIAIARSHGDERLGNVILQEAGRRAAVIGRAFSEARSDRCDYDFATLDLRARSVESGYAPHASG